jgi:hypothetical protein
MKSKSKLFDRLAAELVAGDRQKDEFTVNDVVAKMKANGVGVERRIIYVKLLRMIQNGEASVRIGRENGKQCYFYR